MIIKKVYYIRCLLVAIIFGIIGIIFLISAFVNFSNFKMNFILFVSCFCISFYVLFCFLHVPSSGLKAISIFINEQNFIVTKEFDFLHQCILIDDVNKRIIFAKTNMKKLPFRCVKYSDLLSNKLIKIKKKKSIRYELHCILKNCDYEEIIFNLGNSKEYADAIIPFLSYCRKYKPPVIRKPKKIVSKEITSDNLLLKKEEDWNWLEY